MNRFWLVLVSLIAVGLVISAGCIAPAKPINASENATPVPGTIAASYHATLNQPEAQSGFIVTASDIYNLGEVVEFTVTNKGPAPLTCAGAAPSFSVKFQGTNGIWATRMGPEKPNATEKSTLAPGNSTQVYRFVTTGWDAGRYRIAHDCGVVREILLRPQPAAAPTPTPCTAADAGTVPVIRIDPIGDQRESVPFTITGTTSVPAGENLHYTITTAQAGNPFGNVSPDELFTSVVQEGACGTNTWSAMGEIQATGEFFIAITDANRTTTAIKRFSVKSP